MKAIFRDRATRCVGVRVTVSERRKETTGRSKSDEIFHTIPRELQLYIFFITPFWSRKESMTNNFLFWKKIDLIHQLHCIYFLSTLPNGNSSNKSSF